MSTREIPLLGLSPRIPPSNHQAEQALLGALMGNNLACRHVDGLLEPRHFCDPVHGAIYEAVLRGFHAKKLVDVITLGVEFEHTGVLDEVGGTAYLGQLQVAVVGIINAGEYGRAIHDAWLRRELIDIGEEIVNRAFGADPEMDGTIQIEAARRRLALLTEGGPPTDEATAHELAHHVRDRLNAFTEGEMVDGTAVDMREPASCLGSANSKDLLSFMAEQMVFDLERYARSQMATLASLTDATESLNGKAKVDEWRSQARSSHAFALARLQQLSRLRAAL